MHRKFSRRIARTFILATMIVATQAHARFVQFPYVGTDPRDENLNFWQDKNEDQVALDAIADFRDRILEELWLPSSFVESFLLGIHNVSAVRGHTEISERDLAFSANNEFLRTSVAAVLALGHGRSYSTNLVATYMYEFIQDPRSVYEKFLKVQGKARATVQLIAGDRGKIGKSAIVEAYAKLSNRHLVSLDDVTNLEEVAVAVQRAVHLFGNPIFVFDRWDTKRRDLVLAISQLSKFRRLLGAASVVIIEENEKAYAEPYLLVGSLPATSYVDSIHVLKGPRGFEDYAEMMARWKFKGLDDVGSRDTRRVAAFAYDLHQTQKKSATLILRNVLHRQGKNCDQYLGLKADQQRALQTLVDEVKEYYERRGRRF